MSGHDKGRANAGDEGPWPLVKEVMCSQERDLAALEAENAQLVRVLLDRDRTVAWLRRDHARRMDTIVKLLVRVEDAETEVERLRDDYRETLRKIRDGDEVIHLP